MDSIKDIQKTGIAHVVDGSPVKTNPFGGNRAGERAFRRAERIAAALHLLTNHIEEREPIRAAIRSAAIELIVRALALRNEMRAGASSSVIAFAEQVRNLISQVRILAVSGFVSEQNALVMVEALDELGSYVHASERTPLSENVVLSRDELMDIGSVRPVRAEKDNRAVKDTVAIKDSGAMAHTPSSSQGHVSVRRRNIMDVLRAGGALGIREIAANLPEYSEKMIQRELQSLIAEKQVTKAGSKRWSRYNLVS